MALTPTLRPLLTPLRALAACSLLALGSASAHAQALPDWCGDSYNAARPLPPKSPWKAPKSR